MQASLKNAVKRRTHKERAQPQHRRRKFGPLLEKHKDYQQRAQNYHRKERRIQALKKKAFNRNPDEFYYGMVNAKTKEGVHQVDNPAAHVSDEMLKVLRTQDVGYLEMKRAHEGKQIERLKSSLHFIGVDKQQTQSRSRSEAHASSSTSSPRKKSGASSKDFDPDFHLSKFQDGENELLEAGEGGLLDDEDEEEEEEEEGDEEEEEEGEGSQDQEEDEENALGAWKDFKSLGGELSSQNRKGSSNKRTRTELNKSSSNRNSTDFSTQGNKRSKLKSGFKPMNKRTIFVNSVEEAKRFSKAKHFGTVPELADMPFSRMPKEDLAKAPLKHVPGKRTLKRLAKERAKAYAELEERIQRHEKLTKAIEYLNSIRQQQSKGKRVKVKSAQGDRPAQYRWKNERKR